MLKNTIKKSNKIISKKKFKSKEYISFMKFCMKMGFDFEMKQEGTEIKFNVQTHYSLN